MFRNGFLVFLCLLLAACTQPPAPIAMKGQQSFSRGVKSSSGSSYSGSGYQYGGGQNPAYTSPVPDQTEQKVSVDSIGVSDLSPPSKKSAPLSEKKTEDGESKSTINPWTSKPRSENELQESKPDEKIAASSEKDNEVKEEKKTADVYVAKNKKSDDMKWPVASKKIISSFGDKGDGRANDGIYIAAGEGDPVYAVADGEVVYVNPVKDYGNMILIKHSNGKTSTYSHLARAAVEKYQRVKQGETIGYVGTSGNIKKPQLFFSLHKGKEAIDPQKYLSKEVAKLD